MTHPVRLGAMTPIGMTDIMARFLVDVITTERNDPTKVVSRRTINYSNSERRKWLAGHSNWALRNGMAVHTAAHQGEE